MILVFALVGTCAATIAAVSALMMGQPWWIGLASYIGAGMLTVCFSAVFFVFTQKSNKATTKTPNLRVPLPLAEH